MTPLVAVAALVGGCGTGDDGTIPQDQSDVLLSRLDAIESSVASQNCDVAQGQAQEFQETVTGLPTEVDDEVERGLTQAAEQLVELSASAEECAQGASGPSGVLETTTDATTTETTTDETTTDTTTDEEPEEPDEEEESSEPPADDEPPPSEPPAGPPPGAGGDDDNGDSGGIGPSDRRSAGGGR